MLAWTCLLCGTLYLLTLYPIFYNAYYYLYLQQKWRDRNMFIFYIAALCIITFRVSDYLIYCVVDFQHAKPPSTYYSKIVSSLATYFNLILVFFLAVEQLDVAIRIPEVFVSGQDVKDRVQRYSTWLSWFTVLFTAAATVTYTSLWLVLYYNKPEYDKVGGFIMASFQLCAAGCMLIGTLILNKFIKTF